MIVTRILGTLRQLLAAFICIIYPLIEYITPALYPMLQFATRFQDAHFFYFFYPLNTLIHNFTCKGRSHVSDHVSSG